MVFVLLVVGHCQRAAETFGEFQRLPVFRILFGGLLPPENGHGGFHARQQGSDTVYEAAYVRIMFFFFACIVAKVITLLSIIIILYKKAAVNAFP